MSFEQGSEGPMQGPPAPLTSDDVRDGRHRDDVALDESPELAGGLAALVAARLLVIETEPH
jgi:hypothetical protein